MDKIVLLCCTGRSGSTTMQRIINTIPNSNICGENHDAIKSLLRFYKNIKQTEGWKVVSKESRCPNSIYDPMCWYNSYNYNEIVESVKLLITNIFKDSEETTLWGFKEIRWHRASSPWDREKIAPGDTGIELLKEFKELFPQIKIIIHIKQDIDKQSQSAWWADNPSKSKKWLIKSNSILTTFYNDHKDYCYFSTFEDMFDLENIKKMFEFIDCLEYYDEDKIKKVLERK
jgi:hypothetical protein